MVYCNRLIFSKFSASFLKKALFRPFVFKMFSASCFCLEFGHEVAVLPVGGKARKICIINPFLLRVPGGEAPDRTWHSARVLPVPFVAQAFPQGNAWRVELYSSPQLSPLRVC
jgi:hypothetical protein